MEMQNICRYLSDFLHDTKTIWDMISKTPLPKTWKIHFDNRLFAGDLFLDEPEMHETRVVLSVKGLSWLNHLSEQIFTL